DATGVGAAVAAGARMAPAAARMAGSGVRAATSTASSARAAFQLGSSAAGGGLKGAAAGLGSVAKVGTQAAGQRVAAGMRSLKSRAASAFQTEGAGAASGTGRGIQGNATQGESVDATPAATAQPAWAKRLQRRQQISHAATTVAHTLRGGDGGGAGSGPSLRDSDS
ncbi:P-type conjugative transfer protein TrbL, partial [Pseudomonas aeruginosa]